MSLVDVETQTKSLCLFIRTEVDTETKINSRSPKKFPDRRPENPTRLLSIRKRIKCIQQDLPP